MTSDATTPRDTPNVVSAIAVALVCFFVGVALVLPLRRGDADIVQGTPPTAHVESPATPATPGAERSEQAPDDALPVASARTERAPTAAETPTTQQASATEDKPTVQPDIEAPAPTGLQLIQGRVAYLRCDGLQSAEGPFPCPRDLTLEANAWAALAVLPRCRPSLERGGVDIRLDVVRGKATEVRVLPIAGSPEPPLDADRVYACVGKSLSRLNTTLDPLYMVVSLRASLR